MRTCDKCKHSVFIRETAPAGQCLKHPKIISRKSKTCQEFEKEGKDNGENK